MSFLGKGQFEPDDGRKPPSRNRRILWLIITAVGLYFIGSGVIGILTH